MKKTIPIISLIFLITGCAVKQEDSLATKTMKHTANSPLYLGAIGTKAVEAAVLGILYVPLKAASAVKESTKQKKDK